MYSRKLPQRFQSPPCIYPVVVWCRRSFLVPLFLNVCIMKLTLTSSVIILAFALTTGAVPAVSTPSFFPSFAPRTDTDLT